MRRGNIYIRPPDGGLLAVRPWGIPPEHGGDEVSFSLARGRAGSPGELRVLGLGRYSVYSRRQPDQRAYSQYVLYEFSSLDILPVIFHCVTLSLHNVRRVIQYGGHQYRQKNNVKAM